MIKNALTLLFLCLFVACSSKDKGQKATDNQHVTQTQPVEPYYTIVGDSLVIPPFEIEVKLSEKAARKLKKDMETVIVAAYFSSIPIDEKAADEIGQIAVVDKLIELKNGNTLARFEGLKFSKSLYDSLKVKDVQMLINIYSGRHSSENNLLSGGIVEKPASQLKDKRFITFNSLIEEPMSQMPPSVVECFAPPKMPNQPIQKPKLLVNCSETGQMTFADSTLKDMDAFKTEMRSVLTSLQKMGTKTEDLPDLETQGCMMGMSGELRTVFQEIKNSLGKTKR